MRPPWVPLVTLILLTVPAGLGQEDPDTRLLEDASGDVAFQAVVEDAPTPPNDRADWDLVGLHVEEHPEDFTFTLQVEDFNEEQETDRVMGQYIVHFAHNDRSFAVMFSVSTTNGQSAATAALYEHHTDRDIYDYLERLEDPDWDYEADHLQVSVPREHLLDDQGARPYPGRALGNWSVVAQGIGFAPGGITIMDGVETEGIQYYDRMPDTGFGTEDLPIRFGVEQVGHVRVGSDEPFRFSNGEASTFVFTATISNRNELEDTVHLDFKDVPSGWDVRTPATLVALPANDTIEVPVVLRTAFSHAHGDTKAFVLEARSDTDDRAVGRMEMGIHYPKVPQPAGHHSEIFLHSRDVGTGAGNTANDALGTALGGEGGQVAYMNTLDDHDGDMAVPVEGDYCNFFPDEGGSIPASTHCWRIYLEPGLKMGLDFNRQEIGGLQAPFSTLVPLLDAELFGRVVVEIPEVEEISPGFNITRYVDHVVATIEPDGPKEIGADQVGTLTATLNVTEEGDLMPYHPEAALRLDLGVLTQRPDNYYIGPHLRPELEPGGTMTLPLLEYEDPVTEVFGQGGTVELLADGQERLVNPGKTVVYNVTLRNNGPVEDAFRLDLAGSNMAWAQIVEGNAVTIGSGGSGTLTVAVTAPRDAVDEDRADLILQAQSAGDPNTRALVRLLTTVDVDAEHPDESALAGLRGLQEESPLPVVALLTALAATLLARRRQGG